MSTWALRLVLVGLLLASASISVAILYWLGYVAITVWGWL